MDLTQNELDQLRTAMNAELDRLIAARKPEVKQWPVAGDTYYFDDAFAGVNCMEFMLASYDGHRINTGNFFKTQSEANRRVEALKVQAELRRMPFITDPAEERNAWFLCHIAGAFAAKHNATAITDAIAGVFFESGKAAKYALDTIGQERLQLWLDDYLQTPIGGE